MNQVYQKFQEIQNQWKATGAVPRGEDSNLWQTYRHHVDIFYNILHMNRELRDQDYKKNLEGKQKLVNRAQELANEPDLQKALQELCTRSGKTM